MGATNDLQLGKCLGAARPMLGRDLKARRIGSEELRWPIEVATSRMKLELQSSRQGG